VTDRPRSGRRLDFLDALRGVAVALVLVQHVGERLFPAVREFGAHVAQLGQLGVVVFFLCSGFIIPASLERPGDGGRAARLRSFWRSRFFRLFPLYWVSLAGALLLAGLGRGTAAGVLHAGGWLANATMLQGLAGVPHALGIYWTLTCELLFYVGASLLYLAGRHRQSVAISLAGAGACLVAAVLSGPVLHRPAPLAVFCLATMFTGTVFHRWHSGATSLRALAGCVTATLGAGIVLLCSSLRDGAPGDPEGTRSLVPMMVAWTAAYALFCGGVLLRDRRLPRALPFLGRISYSAYLMHALVLLAVPALPWPMLTAAVWIAVTVIVATLTHRLVELPTVRLGRTLGTRPNRAADAADAGAPSLPPGPDATGRPARRPALTAAAGSAS
jgi:peptidoglycan/LPS O-acetylase OafA/YrhL